MKKLILVLFAFASLTALSGCKFIPEPMPDPGVENVMLDENEEDDGLHEEDGDAMEDRGVNEPAEEVSAENEDVPDTMERKPETPPSTDAVYEDYSEAKFLHYKGKEKVAVFFHASWCPSCRVTDAKIKENLASLDNAVIFKADYDAESDLKREFKVLLQDTIVFLNADGSVAKVKIAAGVDDIKSFFGS